MLWIVVAALCLSGCGSSKRATVEETTYILSVCYTDPALQSGPPFRSGAVEVSRCVDGYPSCKSWRTSTQAGEEVARPVTDAVAIAAERSCRAAGSLYETIDETSGPGWSTGGAEEVGRALARRVRGG